MRNLTSEASVERFQRAGEMLLEDIARGSLGRWVVHVPFKRKRPTDMIAGDEADQH